LHDATTDSAVIESWWHAHPDANVGIRTGSVSNIIAIDCDIKNGQQGRESIKAWRLPATLISNTPSGGWHCLYQHPGYEIRNRTGLKPGIDIRGDGGYIVAPPSALENGAYTWVIDGDFDAVVPLPDHLLQLLKSPVADAKPSGAVVAEGGRNNFLTQLGGAMRGQGLEQEAIEAALLAENDARCQPPLPDKEVRRIAASMARYPNSKYPDFPDPAQLPNQLPPVAQLTLDLLPEALRVWVEDVSERMQCPPDFPAVACIVMASSLIGRQVAIRPKQLDEWTVVPNLWGAVIGRPGVMKTPAMREALKGLYALENLERDQHGEAMQDYQHDLLETRNRQQAAAQKFRKECQKNGNARLVEIAEPDKPVRRRYIVNDATVEKLGELLNENPNGLLLIRDELSGFLRNLGKQGREGERSFYLEAWNGDQSFTYDRIGRGTIDIESCTISILGSIQPGPFLAYMRSNLTSGALDDGLLQRFQLLVWPDDPGKFRDIDRPPNPEAQKGIRELVSRLIYIRTGQLTIGSEGAFVSFDSEALRRFQAWREDLENRIRSGDEHPMMEAHLAKYRSLVPSLALIFHVIKDKEVEPRVRLDSLEQAIGFAEYLETHAQRAYASTIHADIDAARLLAKQIQRGNVPDQFALRDVYRHGWSGLSTPEIVKSAVTVLEDFDWVYPRNEPTAGRNRLVYTINPKICTGTSLTKATEDPSGSNVSDASRQL
jgi:putative DNA primase/helicase